jgi:hypothetical protein
MNPRRLAPAVVLAALLASVPAARAQLAAPPPDQADTKLDAHARSAVLDTLIADLHADYVFPEVADRLDRELRARQKRGAFDGLASAQAFADTLTSILRTVGHDAHFRVLYRERPVPELHQEGPVPPEELARLREQERRTNYGVERVERLIGNVGYLEMRSFNSSSPETGEAIAAAMKLLEHTDALVIDVRRNGGGRAEWVQQLCSYLFSGDDRTLLNELVMRRGGSEHVESFYTVPWVPGPRRPDVPVYVLTSHATGSAAEEFAYNLQSRKRGTVVGETTWGGANPGGLVRLSDHFAAFISNGRARNPVTHTNWEGVGVRPDVPVAPGDALKTAHVMALEKLIAGAQDTEYAGWLKHGLDQVRAAPAAAWEDPRPRRGP